MTAAKAHATNKKQQNFDVAARRLAELCSLPIGWNGYAGQPVNPQIAEFALHLLAHNLPCINSPVQFVPGSDGDLQMEWHTKSADLELHIKAPGEAAGFYRNVPAGVECDERNLVGDFSVLAQWLQQMGKYDGFANMAAA